MAEKLLQGWEDEMSRSGVADLLKMDGAIIAANPGVLAESREHNAKTMRSFASKMRRPAEMVMVIRYDESTCV